MQAREERRSRSRLLAATLVVSLLCILVVCWELGRGEPHYNLDEGSHALTGMFFLDLLRDMPLGDPMGYTWDWYAHYPGLGVLLWPPLFHAVLALGFAVLGPSLATGQLVVLVFLVVACLAWLFLARGLIGVGWGLLAASLFVTAPMVAVYSRMIMLEVPSLALASGAFALFYRFVEKERTHSLYGAATLAGLALLTKPHTVFLAPVVLLVVLGLGRRDLLRNAHCLLASLLVLLLAAPYYILVVVMTGRVALDNAVSAPESPMGWTSLSRYTYYPAQLPLQLGWPLAILCLLALLAAPVLLRRAAIWPLAWIGGGYLTMTALALKSGRYLIYWIPGWCLLLCGCLAVLVRHRRIAKWRRPVLAAITLASLAQMCWGIAHERPFFQGYEAAAKWIAERTPDRATVMTQTLYDPTFFFYLRISDPERRILALRGEKMLVAYRITPLREQKELVKGREGVESVLGRYAVRYVLTDEPRAVEARPLKTLRGMLGEAGFPRVTSIRISSDRARDDGRDLVIWEVRDWKPIEAEWIDLEMLTLGRTVRVPLD